MKFDIIENCEMPKASFIHVCGKLYDADTNSDFVINVDKINYIKELPDDKTLINFSDTSIVVNYNYYDLLEVFLNQVNLLFHLNEDF